MCNKHTRWCIPIHNLIRFAFQINSKLFGSHKIGMFDLNATCWSVYAKLTNSVCLYFLCWHHTLSIILTFGQNRCTVNYHT